MSRGRDIAAFNNQSLIYYPTHGKLAPDQISPDNVATGAYDDPLKNVTYAVFRVGMTKTKLDPTFNFRA